VAEAGEFELRLGRSSRDVLARAGFRLERDHAAGPERALGGPR
jgi:hypothetical protein